MLMYRVLRVAGGRQSERGATAEKYLQGRSPRHPVEFVVNGPGV